MCVNSLFILGLLFLILALYLRTDPTYMKVLYAFLIAVFIAYLHVYLLSGQIEVGIIGEEAVQISKGESVELTLVIKNNCFLQSPYIHIFLKPTYHVVSKQYQSLCITLPPFSKKEIKIAYEGKYSGKDILEIEEVILQDFFQLAKKRHTSFGKKEVAVLPQIIELTKVNYLFSALSIDTDSTMSLPKPSKTAELSYELKPYKEGDSLKLLHWKIAARRDIYMVRQREEQVSVKEEYLMVLDPICAEKNEEMAARLIDKTLVMCISLVAFFLERDIEVTLVYDKEGHWQYITLTHNAHLGQLASILAQYGITTDANLEERLPYNYLRGIHKKEASKLVVTPAVNRSLLNHLDGEKNMNVLAMLRTVYLGECFGYGWYVTDEFEVVRNV